MKLESIANWVDRLTLPPNKWLHWVSMIVLLLLMFLTVADVVGRYLVGIIPWVGPVSGSFELTEFMLAVVVLTAIGYTQIKGEHISIDLVISKFSRKTRAVIDSVTNLLSLIMFVLVTWQTIKYARLLFVSNDVSGVLRVPVYPFLVIAAVGSLFFCLAMLASFLQSLKRVVLKNGS